MRLMILALCCAASISNAQGRNPVHEAATAAFDRMPVVRVVDRIAGVCGADDHVNEEVAYCTSQNTIFVARSVTSDPKVHYLQAHALGHAIQVQHGIADFALAQIRARRDEENALRGLVARQVECLAGMLHARSGLPSARLTDWFNTEPFAGSHWGRDPLAVGPQVSIGLSARAEWFAKGQLARSPADCAVGELPAAPLVEAFKG